MKQYLQAISGFILLVLLAYLFIMCSGCSLFKQTTRNSTDTSQVRKSDSVRVTKNESTSNTNAEWWREIINYRPHDSTYIEKTERPVYITQPVQIIREGGTVKQQTATINYDSLRYSRTDSLMALFIQSQTKTKTNVLPLGFWIGIGIVGALLLFVLYRLNIIKKPL